MPGKLVCRVTFVVLALIVTGCAARFSPETVRREIVSQRGQDPLGVFELNLGRFTTLMIKSALAGEDGTLPFAGLQQLQLAVYEAPAESGPALDVTRFSVWGWEPVLRTHDVKRSAMVLVRRRGDAVGDLVVVGAGEQKVVYARLRGRLSPDLPSALGEVARQGGPDEVRRVLTQLGEGRP